MIKVSISGVPVALLPRPSTPSNPLDAMLKTLFTVVPLLAAIASTSARPYARAPIDETTLTKVRANAIAISKKR